MIGRGTLLSEGNWIIGYPMTWIKRPGLAVVLFAGVSVLLASGFLVAGVALAAASVPPPHLEPAREILAGILPKSCGDVVPDEEGALWCSDFLQKRIVKITPAGKVTEVLESAPLFTGGLENPGGLSLWGSLLAVEDQNHTLHIVDVKTKRHIRTLPYETLHGAVKMNPSAGFALWKDRILFTGLGFEGPPPPFDHPVEALTLFSTGLDGRGLAIVKRETLSVLARPGRTLFGLGFAASVQSGGMAVCQALPPRLILLGPEGKVLREAVVAGLDVPVIPHALMMSEDFQAETLATTPHIVGMFTLKDWIALVVKRPSPLGPHLSVAWFASNLNPAKEDAIELPIKLAKWDVVARVAYAPPNGVLFLVRHQEPGIASSSRLYRSQVQ